MVDVGYLQALRDLSLWIGRVALNPKMDPATLAALNEEIARLAEVKSQSEAA